MIRLSALNDNSSDESEPERTQESIKQAQESEALELYNKALQYQHVEDYAKATETYQELLLSALVCEAPTPDPDEDSLHHPGQVLKYSAYKNLAVLAENKGEYEKATDNYLEAVMLDDSDVTVWYHIGKVSIKCFNLTLARQAFEEGLRCNPKHWPCLDELCTVLYTIGDYPTCLVMISDALEEDENYLKGLALRDKIFKEEPYFKRDYRHLRSLYLTDIEEDDIKRASEFVDEALHLREERLKLIEASKADPPLVNPVKPLTSYTWAALGDCFIVLYDHMTSPDHPQSLGRVVNLDDYYKAIVTPDISMPHKASLGKVSDNLAGSSFSTEGFGVYKSAGSSDNDEKTKKATKRKKPPTSGLESDFPPKRRSARVRTSKKKEEETNYKDLIQAYLPFSLRVNTLGDDESSQDSFGESQQTTTSQTISQDGKVAEKGPSREYEDVISGEAETLDVLTFVKEHMANGGVLDLMTKYGISLAAQRNKKWPPALADVFVKVYTRLRKHIMLPAEFIRDADEVYTGELAKVILVATELTLDKLLTAKSKSSSSLSPASSPRGGQAGVSPIRVGPGFSSKFLASDIEYLHCIALDRTIHGDGWLEFAIRVNWAKARYLMLQGLMEIAMLYLDRCTKLLAVEVSPLSEPMTVKLVNCKIDNNVTLEQVHKKLESLQRCQSLEEVHRLYELGHYEDVVQLLIPTLHQPQPKAKASELGMSIPERPAQLLLLQDSLIKLKDFRRCLECSEVALNEAVSQMSPCEAWSTTLSRLFQCMNTCIEELDTILDGFPQTKLTSLTLNIIKVIEASIYSSDVSIEPPLATAYPWVLLYKIIKNKEKDEEMEVVPPPKPDTPLQSTPDNPVPGEAVNTSTSNDNPSLPASLHFLRTAHEQLGRRGWCCNNDGIFLLMSVEALTQQLAKPFMFSREDIVRDLEQCFLCLYGHPSKKAKLKGLQEHNSCQMPLTWQNSAIVFNYFKPSELPSFDSKTYTISTEVQNLMRRVTLAVPSQELEAISFDDAQAFIDGLSDEVPKLPENMVSKERPVVGELFYLLADFYFKNKEFSKALKFYTHDICIKPNRSDSWAAMALIRKSRLESKLNACEPKSAGPIQKHAVAALKCFKRAMETDSTNSSILEEYGSLCYFLHSHASRQLKQFDQEEVSMETRASLLQRKNEMLHLSEEIFSNALGMVDSEAWLHHYMLGKIAEKLKKPPQVYLEHYAKSARFLDDDIKHYPRKIPFYSPPDHILEALEVYYRIHVSVLKLVLKDFDTIDKVVLEKHLQLAAKGPFFQPEHEVDSVGHVVYSESTTSEISAEYEKEHHTEPALKKQCLESHQTESLASDVAEKDTTTTKTDNQKTVSDGKELDQEDTKSEVGNDSMQPISRESLTSARDDKNQEIVTSDRDSTFKIETKDNKTGFESHTHSGKPGNIKKKDLGTDSAETQEAKVENEQKKPPCEDNTNKPDGLVSESPEEKVSLEYSQLKDQTHDVEMKDEETSVKQADAREGKTVVENKPIAMDTEDSTIKAKEITDETNQKNVQIDEEQTKTTESEAVERDMSEVPPKLASSAVDRMTLPLTIKKEQVQAFDFIASPNEDPGKSLPMENNRDIAGNSEKPLSIEPMTIAESTAIKDQQDTDVSSKTAVNFSPIKEVFNKPSGDSRNVRDDMIRSLETSNYDQEKPSDLSHDVEMETQTALSSTIPNEKLMTETTYKENAISRTNSGELQLTDVQKQTQRELLDICIQGLEHCLQRFPQHHKSRYRLAYVNYVSPYNKDVQASRALLLGGNNGKAKLSRNPQQGLFNEKSKTNLFSAFWRIPEEDIDRPGSFCTHTYKSVDLLLQILRELNEWDSLVNISNLLHRTPEAGKKYLRDNERHFLAKKACEFTVGIISKLVESQDPQSAPLHLSQLVMDNYECWKISQKYEHTAKVSENLLIKSFEMYRAKEPDNLLNAGDTQLSPLEKALRFCQQIAKPQTSSVSTAPQTPVESSSDSQTGDVIMQEQPCDVILSPSPTATNQQDADSRVKDNKVTNGGINELSMSVDQKKEILSSNDGMSKTSVTKPKFIVTNMASKQRVASSDVKIDDVAPAIGDTYKTSTASSASTTSTAGNSSSLTIIKEVLKAPISSTNTQLKTLVHSASSGSIVSNSSSLTVSKEVLKAPISSTNTQLKTLVHSASSSSIVGNSSSLTVSKEVLKAPISSTNTQLKALVHSACSSSIVGNSSSLTVSKEVLKAPISSTNTQLKTLVHSASSSSFVGNSSSLTVSLKDVLKAPIGLTSTLPMTSVHSVSTTSGNFASTFVLNKEATQLPNSSSSTQIKTPVCSVSHNTASVNSAAAVSSKGTLKVILSPLKTLPKTSAPCASNKTMLVSTSDMSISKEGVNVPINSRNVILKTEDPSVNINTTLVSSSVMSIRKEVPKVPTALNTANIMIPKPCASSNTTLVSSSTMANTKEVPKVLTSSSTGNIMTQDPSASSNTTLVSSSTMANTKEVPKVLTSSSTGNIMTQDPSASSNATLVSSSTMATRKEGSKVITISSTGNIMTQDPGASRNKTLGSLSTVAIGQELSNVVISSNTKVINTQTASSSSNANLGSLNSVSTLGKSPVSSTGTLIKIAAPSSSRLTGDQVKRVFLIRSSSQPPNTPLSKATIDAISKSIAATLPSGIAAPRNPGNDALSDVPGSHHTSHGASKLQSTTTTTVSPAVLKVPSSTSTATLIFPAARTASATVSKAATASSTTVVRLKDTIAPSHVVPEVSTCISSSDIAIGRGSVATVVTTSSDTVFTHGISSKIPAAAISDNAASKTSTPSTTSTTVLNYIPSKTTIGSSSNLKVTSAVSHEVLHSLPGANKDTVSTAWTNVQATTVPKNPPKQTIHDVTCTKTLLSSAPAIQLITTATMTATSNVQRVTANTNAATKPLVSPNTNCPTSLALYVSSSPLAAQAVKSHVSGVVGSLNSTQSEEKGGCLSRLTQEKQQTIGFVSSTNSSVVVQPAPNTSVSLLPSQTKTSPIIESTSALKPRKELTALKMEKLENKIARLKHAAEAQLDGASSANIPSFLQPSKPPVSDGKSEEKKEKNRK